MSDDPRDPVLNNEEVSLFTLMRDEVILDLRTDSVSPPFTWHCHAVFGDGGHERFVSKISALDAYMQAYAVFVDRKLRGLPVYSTNVLKRRKKQGLS